MLKSHKSDRSVKFDPDLFSEADVDAMLAEMKPVRRRAAVRARPVRAMAGIDVLPTRRDLDRALADAVAVLKDDPTLAKALTRPSGRKAKADARKRLVAGLRERTIDERVVKKNLRERERVELVVRGSVMSLMVAGRPILRGDTRTALGVTMAFVIQAIMVVIDVVFVIAAIVGVAVYTGQKWAQKIADTGKKLKQPIVAFCQRLLEALRECLPKLRDAVGKAKADWLMAVKDSCGCLSRGIYGSMQASPRKELLGALRDVVKAVFAGKIWAIVTAILSFIATVAAIIATCGASLAFQLANLVAQVAFLAVDVITLATMPAA